MDKTASSASATIRMLEVTVELCRVFAKDHTEKANVDAVDLLGRSFGAATAALFYVNGRDEYRFCLAGTDYPIALAKDTWRESIDAFRDEAAARRSGPWSPPGFGNPLPYWMHTALYSSQADKGYIMLGKASGDWLEGEASSLNAMASAIEPIIRVRYEREIQERERRDAEALLVKNERRLRTFLEESRDMIYTADADDAVTEVNAAGLVLLGRAGKDAVIGRKFASFALNPEDRELFLSRLRSHGSVADYEIVLKRPDDSPVFCLETAQSVRDASGGIAEVRGIVKDITERIKNEQELWKATMELVETNMKLQQTQQLMVQQEKLASIGQLAAGIAHEINNPLGFLKSNHAVLARYFRDFRDAWREALPAAGETLEVIGKKYDLEYVLAEIDAIFAESGDGFERIVEIISNLKNFARIDQSAEFDMYDINAGMESTLVVARNKLKYVAEVQKELGTVPLIRAKGGEINQVILNMLVNAAQAIESQGRAKKGQIVVSTTARGDCVVCRIQDDGPGIPESIRNRIFDPFFTTKEPGKGTGLGLSISYDIVVTKHGGKLSVESEPGHGSVFEMELPVEGKK